MRQWHLRHGSWWMVQWCLDGWLSLGIHVDFKRRVTGDGARYGPYVDVHLGVVVVSVGVNPKMSGDLESGVSVSRGGVSCQS